MATLPTPVTVNDCLLKAIHDELVGLRADLAAARGGEPAPADQKLLEEPKKAPAVRSKGTR